MSSMRLKAIGAVVPDGFLEGTYQKDMFDRPLKIYTLLGHIKSVQIRNHFVSRSIVELPRACSVFLWLAVSYYCRPRALLR